MATIISTDDGQKALVFARIGEGFVDLVCRAASRSAWLAAATSQGLLAPDGNPVPGVLIDVIGPVAATPAVYNALGEEVSAADVDLRHHVNVRLAADFDWKPVVLVWMEGNDDALQNNTEKTRTVDRVSLIDPDSIKSPIRVWA